MLLLCGINIKIQYNRRRNTTSDGRRFPQKTGITFAYMNGNIPVNLDGVKRVIGLISSLSTELHQLPWSIPHDTPMISSCKMKILCIP